MRECLQALKETYQQLRNALQGKSTNAGSGSGVGGRQGLGCDMGSSPSGSGGSRKGWSLVQDPVGPAPDMLLF